jgi:hypothetical protein
MAMRTIAIISCPAPFERLDTGQQIMLPYQLLSFFPYQFRTRYGVKGGCRENFTAASIVYHLLSFDLLPEQQKRRNDCGPHWEPLGGPFS